MILQILHANLDVLCVQRLANRANFTNAETRTNTQ